MGKLYEVPFEGGVIVFAAADGGPSAYSAATPIARASQSLEEAFEMVKAMGAVVARRLSEIECKSAEATFGITLSGKGRFIVAEVGTEASIEIKLVFDQRQESAT